MQSIDNINWCSLGRGAFNTTYVNDKKAPTMVLKIAHDPADETDVPERSVRLWNEINHHLTPPAFLASTDLGGGWICPYISGRQSTDDEIACALIDIYNRTGRVIIDAASQKNFITTNEGRVVCVDMGLALRIQFQKTFLHTDITLSKRRNSIVSDKYGPQYLCEYHTYFANVDKVYPQATSTIKALLFIQKYRPDIVDVSSILSNVQDLACLSLAYDCQDENNVDKAMNCLLQNRPVSLDTIKDNLSTFINNYISSRGSIDIKGHFDPSFVTKCFRNQDLTTFKVTLMKKLMADIDATDSLEQVETLCHEILNNDKAIRGRISHGVKHCLTRCLASIDVIRNIHARCDTPRLQF